MKILFISEVPLIAELGAGKVQFELKKRLVEMGVEVSQFDSRDAFPNKRTRLDRILGKTFSEVAKKYIQENGCKYDVIDAPIADLPYSKIELNFNGILIARSHGLSSLHNNTRMQYLYNVKLERKTRIKNVIGDILRMLERHKPKDSINKSLEASDRIILLNRKEKEYIDKNASLKIKSKVIYNGKPYMLEQYNSIDRSNFKKIVFIGRWSKDKGAHDLLNIIKALSLGNSNYSFLILGTGNNRAHQLALESLEGLNVEIIPTFLPKDLTSLLSEVKIGLFPSYMEGFSFAVIEQMSLGIPVIAYDIPGVQDALSEFKDELLSPISDWKSALDKARKILEADYKNYLSLSEAIQLKSNDFSWEKIANDYVNFINDEV
jgi:glycosyltransferase involved in cell wall biosynthesis